jgi:hypothetical protein
MGNKKRDRKAKIASQKKLLASVTEEMARPRMAKSTSMKSDKQMNAWDEKPVPYPVGTK